MAYKKCGAKKSNGDGTCTQPAGAGTDHVGWGKCKYHGGTSQSGKVAAAREEANWIGQLLEIEPADALLQSVHMSAGTIEWLRAQMKHGDPEKVGVYAKLYGEERDRLAKTAALCIQAGLAERQVKLAEMQGELMARALKGILSDLNLTAEQEAVAPEVVARHLRAVS